ncbi:Retrotransposon gag protein [Gossypium australe]|uniref:Retrotransposon gag protein n=1 Tax=Gossypium australe TaxID=47621 RepID=A0A5B6WFP2_9ROSI|nr:Retrotransposon gag protein [Gossypium australe]
MERTRREIPTKFEGESFHETCEHFKKFILKCPHHGLPEWLQLQIFYNGLDVHSRSRLDRVIGGALMNRMYGDAYKLIESMIINSCLWLTERYTYG